MKKNSLYEYSRKFIPFKWLDTLGFIDISQDSITNLFIEYILPILLGVMIIPITYLSNFFPDKTPFYITNLVIIAAYTRFGGLRAALILTGFIAAEAFLLFKSSDLLIQLIFFVGSSVLVSYIVNKARQMNTVRKLKIQEKIYAQAYVKLQADYLKARDEIRARDEFLSIASHELKTPLTTMLLKLNNMLNTVKNVSLANFSVQELMAVLANAEQQIKWLTAMINDLLNVSLIATGRMSLEREEMDLVVVTKQVLENFTEVLKRDNYTVNFKDGFSVVGRWDRTRIEQAITNLLSNAIKYGKSKPIDIKIISNDTLAKFIIRDRGIGIPVSEQKTLFTVSNVAKTPVVIVED